MSSLNVVASLNRRDMSVILPTFHVEMCPYVWLACAGSAIHDARADLRVASEEKVYAEPTKFAWRASKRSRSNLTELVDG